jgi:hypothetical protein
MALTLTTHDTRFDHPDAATIAKVLASLDGGRNVIATLERSEMTYLQAEGSVDAGFTLECQEDSLDRRHRSRAGAMPLGQVTEMFQAYARGDRDWRRGVEWDHVPFVPPRVPWFSTWWGYVLVLGAVAGLIWWWRG